jgi:hypothetical protein
MWTSRHLAVIAAQPAQLFCAGICSGAVRHPTTLNNPTEISTEIANNKESKEKQCPIHPQSTLNSQVVHDLVSARTHYM